MGNKLLSEYIDIGNNLFGFTIGLDGKILSVTHEVEKTLGVSVSFFKNNFKNFVYDYDILIKNLLSDYNSIDKKCFHSHRSWAMMNSDILTYQEALRFLIIIT